MVTRDFASLRYPARTDLRSKLDSSVYRSPFSFRCCFFQFVRVFSSSLNSTIFHQSSITCTSRFIFDSQLENPLGIFRWSFRSLSNTRSSQRFRSLLAIRITAVSISRFLSNKDHRSKNSFILFHRASIHPFHDPVVFFAIVDNRLVPYRYTRNVHIP